MVFLSDIFYWQEKEHPMLEVVKMFLVNFNDYFVENFYSKIWANTSSGDSVDTIIKQACVLGNTVVPRLYQPIWTTIIFMLI